MRMEKIEAGKNLLELRRIAPLVHNITNFVVMNSTANALLAAGASPVMAHAMPEMEEMTSLAHALVLNIGTLSEDWIEAMLAAGRVAARRGIPIVLDPVGAGATSYRTKTAERLLKELPITILRGNASEIMAVSGAVALTRGVDSSAAVNDAVEHARSIANLQSLTAVITGPVDIITDGTRSVSVANGHPLMSRVTGTGCAATALIAAFASVDSDPLKAASAALAFYGLAGERAAAKAGGPGTFWPLLLDQLHGISPDELDSGAKIKTGQV